METLFGVLATLVLGVFVAGLGLTFLLTLFVTLMGARGKEASALAWAVVIIAILSTLSGQCS